MVSSPTLVWISPHFNWRKVLNVRSFSRLTAKEASAPEVPASKENVKERAQRIMTQYGNSILRYAYAYLHSLSDAEDVLQDTLIQFLKAAPVFESDSHEKAWLLRVAGNLSRNRLRYNRYRQTDELRDGLMEEERENLSFVWEAVQSLPVKYREVIHLYYKEGYQTAQIAKILNRKEATIRSDLLRGREKLRTILKEDYDFE